MKEQKWFEVDVTLDDGDKFKDSVWSTTKKEAETVANWNWEYAKDIDVNE